MKNKFIRGFTLAELLIVMAIIVVLAAVAIPTFGRQLETSRETGDMEVIRNAYTEALSFAIQDGADGALDGYIGAPPANKANITWGAVTHLKDTQRYYVTLATMNGGKFAQSGTTVVGENASAAATGPAVGAWTYVSNQLMGKVVPPVNTAVKYLLFEFQFNAAGEVEVKGLNVNKTANSLFVPSKDAPAQ